MEEYKQLEQLYRKISLADLSELCRHHVESFCMDLKRLGETWLPINVAKEFAEYAACRLKRPVTLTGNKEVSTYYKAGEVQQIKLQA